MNRPAMKPNVIISSITMMMFSKVVCVVPPFWNNQHHRGDRADDATADEQRQTEQQVQGDRTADHFGQIGGDGDDLSLHEEHEPARVAKPFAQDFRQALPVTMPSFADWYWISTLMQLASTSTHTNR